ncbi:MAG: methylated-DNA--[protein]-cysteine S-methyltransferase [Neptunomonas phycophila]|uniref:bifunctional transcriptional activator/DNA repair enzyme AdaA n=1 Tax=Neptunomonas phycophila TaxID=1572645 RepID=UPI003B8DCF19
MPTTESIITVARHIEAHANEKLPLTRLAQLAHLSPSHFQRLFTATLGVSPKEYQDAIRMELFKSLLKTEPTVTDAIFAAGFSSVSRLYGEASRQMGMTPSSYKDGGTGEVISYAFRDSSLGLLLMAATLKGVCYTAFGESESILFDELVNEFPQASFIPSTAYASRELDDWIDALDQHLASQAPLPSIPLDMRGTAFQIKVWKYLTRIPAGVSISYSELATHIGNPKAFRAAASACGANRIGVLIPCHRVLRGDGSLGGFRWGLTRKQALLNAEKGLSEAAK